MNNVCAAPCPFIDHWPILVRQKCSLHTINILYSRISYVYIFLLKLARTKRTLKRRFRICIRKFTWHHRLYENTELRLSVGSGYETEMVVIVQSLGYLRSLCFLWPLYDLKTNPNRKKFCNRVSPPKLVTVFSYYRVLGNPNILR